MRFFITGISGFIAKHLATRLVAMGHSVDAVGHANIEGVNYVDSFKLQTSRYDYVIHLAATTSLSETRHLDVIENNILFARAIFNYPGRIIYASSTSVYEKNNLYAISKAYNEALGERHGNALGLRLFNVYGPGNNKGIVKRVIDCCLKGEKLTLQGGDQVRDFIYVDDVVDIIIDYLGSPLKVMDVGTGVGTPIYSVVNQIVTEMCLNGCKAPDTTFLKSDYHGEQMTSIAGSYSPLPLKDFTPLREGIRKTIEETLKQR